MKIQDVINLVNRKLADEFIGVNEQLVHLDAVIDDINAELNAVFPTFTQVLEDNGRDIATDYVAIPDKYIRSVIATGAAFKFYTTDEEGGYSAPKYEEEYRKALFYMVRDFSLNVPEEYQANNQGFLPINIAGSDSGLIVNPWNY